MAQKAAIKSRIKSINATKKITGAMELIATVKLQKQRNRMLSNREYMTFLTDTMNTILSGDIDSDNEFLKERVNTKKAVFVFCSDLGLCGGYNVNVLKEAEKFISKEDDVYVVGATLYKALKGNYNVVNKLLESDSCDYNDIKRIADKAINDYKDNLIGSIYVIYTKFVNNVSFEPCVEKILPCKKEKAEKTSYKEIILEPNANEILNDLIPMYVVSDVHTKWLEAKTSEQGSRRFAMENATDNANELTDELLLAYNQARQAAITQEITEIVSGADAI